MDTEWIINTMYMKRGEIRGLCCCCCFVDIGGIVDYYCLSFLPIMNMSFFFKLGNNIKFLKWKNIS